MMRCVWDPGKITANREKRGASFDDLEKLTKAFLTYVRQGERESRP